MKPWRWIWRGNLYRAAAYYTQRERPRSLHFTGFTCGYFGVGIIRAVKSVAEVQP